MKLPWKFREVRKWFCLLYFVGLLQDDILKSGSQVQCYGNMGSRVYFDRLWGCYRMIFSNIWPSNRYYGNTGSRVRWTLFISTLNDDTVCMNIVDVQIQW